MGYLVGVLYCYLWYTSILAGYLCLYCPLLPVLLISNRLYRYCTDVIFTFWQAYPTVLLQFMCKCEIQVTGDSIRSNEMAILIMNHRTRTDWNFLWPALYHCTKGNNKYRYSTKFLLKDTVRHLPGPGWVLQLSSSIFIKRCWFLDKNILEKFCQYLSVLSYKCSILIFPEGTDLTDRTKKRSHEFAKKNNFEEYEYVLHPRTTGFAFLCHNLMEKKCLDAVYNITLVYPDLVPQNERLLLQGKFPSQVKIHIVRYPSSMMPNSENDLKKFLEDKWAEKEKTLKHYHATQNFLHGQILKNDDQYVLLCALIFWTLLPYVSLYFLIFNYYFRQICFAHTIFLIAINFIIPGFQYLEISIYELKNRILGL